MNQIEVLESTKIDTFIKGPVYRSLFSNGLTSIFHQAKGRVGASVYIYFLVGSQDEKENEHGVAHLLEHMMFKENGQSPIVKYIESNGGEVNAYTDKDLICFELSCLSRKLKDFFPLFIELVFNPKFTEEDFKIEKEVVFQELSEDFSNHYTFGHEYIIKKLYPPPLGHSVGGDLNKIKNISFKTLRSFHSKYFTPHRVIISTISSTQNKKSLEKDLLKILNNSYRGNLKQQFRYKPFKRTYKVASFKKQLKREIQNPLLFMGFQGPSLNASDYFNFVVLQTLFADGLTSLLYRTLREQEGLVYSLDADIFSYLKYGHFVMSFSVVQENLNKVKKCVHSILENLKNNELTAQEVDKAIERIKDYWEFSFDEIADRCEFLAFQEIYHNADFSLGPRIELLNKVTPKTIKDLVNKYYPNSYFELILKG